MSDRVEDSWVDEFYYTHDIFFLLDSMLEHPDASM